MKKIIAFGASNSRKSINQQLAKWASGLLKDTEVTLLDLNDFEMPLFGVDRELESGIPEKAKQFKQLIDEADGIVISFAEHNGSYSVAFKNVFDWMSRIGKPFWSGKPMFVMGTSPGRRGAKTVLETALNSFPHQGGQVVANFSLPSFRQNFDPTDGIKEPELKNEFDKQLEIFTQKLNE